MNMMIILHIVRRNELLLTYFGNVSEDAVSCYWLCFHASNLIEKTHKSLNFNTTHIALSKSLFFIYTNNFITFYLTVVS